MMIKKITVLLPVLAIPVLLWAGEPVRLEISAQHDFNPDAFGFNTQTAAGPSWDDSLFLQRLSELYPANLRYPGGTIGNYLDWRTGQYRTSDLRDPELAAPRQGIMGPGGSKEINRYRLEELRNGVAATGACPVYMLNMLTDTLPGSIEMLAHARELGLPVRYIELGNEFYLTYSQGGKAPDHIGDYARDIHFPTAESYAAEAKRYVSELRKIYPEARFACNVVMSHPKELWYSSSPRTVGWNEVLKSADIGAEAVVVHLYTNNGATPEALVINAVREIEEMGDFTEHVFPGMSVWVTEYNAKCDAISRKPLAYRNAYACQWIHGMNSVVMAAQLLMLPQVELLCFHDIAASTASAVIFADDVDIPLARGSSEIVKAQPLTFSATGYAFSLLGYAMQGAGRIARVVPDKVTFTNGLEALWGWLFTGDSRRMVLLNFSADAIEVNTTLDNLPGRSVRQYAADRLTRVIDSPSALIMSPQQPCNADGSFTLQPYSAAVVDY